MLKGQADELSRDTSVGAIADPDDDLLADIAALRVADRVVEPRFERDRLLARVHEELGNPALDSKNRRVVIVETAPARQHGVFEPLRVSVSLIHVHAGKTRGDG